jgi:peptidoglycan-associated lipoprotein
MRLATLFSYLVLVLPCVACAASASTTATETAATTPSTNQALAAPRETEANVKVAEDILKACGIDRSDAFFAYNSAQLQQRETGIVGKIATCFSTGPLAGRKLSLVGHADPRGNEEYNYALAGRRADSLRQALAKQSLDPAVVSTTSRGALDAKGTDESSWSKDRRVDVLLAP